MASGCFTIAIDNPFNRDVLMDCGIYYNGNVESLTGKMQWALDHEDLLHDYKEKARARILESYTWEKIAEQYEQLFIDTYNGKYPWRLSVHQIFQSFDFSKHKETSAIN
jgi:glycosyltransferase involved in cell wall biosynthesis